MQQQDAAHSACARHQASLLSVHVNTYNAIFLLAEATLSLLICRNICSSVYRQQIRLVPDFYQAVLQSGL